MPAEASYSRLPSIPSGNTGHVDNECASGRCTEQKAGYLSEAFCWRLFIVSCVVSLILSATNLTTLSAWTTIESIRISPVARSPTAGLKQPSPYLGLENVIFEPSYCRRRATFPKTFYTYDVRDAPYTTLYPVHAPDDQITLAFGGPVRAVADVYVPDHGLENCTLNLRHMHGGDADASLSAVGVEVYLRTSVDLVDGGGPTTYLDTLLFAPGKESISRPFYCPSRSHVYFEWRCPARDCQVSLPLEGVTSMTSSPASLAKSGFRVTQYEALHCIDV